MPVEENKTDNDTEANSTTKPSTISNPVDGTSSSSSNGDTPQCQMESAETGQTKSTNGTVPSDSKDDFTSNRMEMLDSLLDDSQNSESRDESSPICNTLDDISSLKTLEEGASPILNEADGVSESYIGEIETKLTPSSLKEPLEADGDQEDKENGEEEDETEDGWLDVIGSGDLMKKILRKGKGVNYRPQRGNVAVVNIEGHLEDGQKVEAVKEKRVSVGDAEVIQGLDLAIPLMELDEISEIVVKPRLAFGKLGRIPDIPPHATITYNVELVGIEDEPDPESITFEERKRIGDCKREIGNFWYSRGEYSSALQCYRKALDFLDDSSTNFTSLNDEQKQLVDTWIKVSNNMAAAQLKIGAYDAALKSVENVLKMQPKNVKALFRKGKILAAMGNTELAISCMKEALKLEPETKIIHQELSNLVVKQKSEVKSEREMYKRMLGQDKQQPTTSSKSSNSFLKFGIIAGGLTAAILSIVAYRHFHGGAME